MLCKNSTNFPSFLSMDLLLLLPLSVWLVAVSSFSAIIATNARPDLSASTVYNSKLHFLLRSQSSSDMAAHSPGISAVKVVYHQDLNKKILVALIVSATLLASILICITCFCIYRRRNTKNFHKKSTADSDIGRGVQLNSAENKHNLSAVNKGSVVTIFEYRALEAATNNFNESNLLCQGEFGSIYSACFSEKFLAIVKRFDESDSESAKQMEIEVNWLSKIHHQNIISLLGYCINGEARFLVYETMPNGSLDSQLHGNIQGSALPWQLRMKIAIHIARGLEFLHERCNPPIVHRNLNSSNILLDSDFNAKLSDFGFAITSNAQTSRSNLKLSGSLNCLAPEYFLDGKLTDKSDVYAYGVILLELLIGKNPAEKITTGQSQTSLVKWAMPLLTDRSKLPSVVDPVVKDTMDLKHLYQVAAVAVLCIQPEPSYRPLITDVLHSLIPLLPVELGGSLRLSEPLNSILQ